MEGSRIIIGRLIQFNILRIDQANYMHAKILNNNFKANNVIKLLNNLADKLPKRILLRNINNLISFQSSKNRINP